MCVIYYSIGSSFLMSSRESQWRELVVSIEFVLFLVSRCHCVLCRCLLLVTRVFVLCVSRLMRSYCCLLAMVFSLCCLDLFVDVLCSGSFVSITFSCSLSSSYTSLKWYVLDSLYVSSVSLSMLPICTIGDKSYSL